MATMQRVDYDDIELGRLSHDVEIQVEAQPLLSSGENVADSSVVGTKALACLLLQHLSRWEFSDCQT